MNPITGTKRKFLFWSPRLLSILTILFVSIFALDVFDSRLSFLQQLTGFLMHLIPSFVLLIVLIIAWKRELMGGFIYILLGIIFSIFIFYFNYKRNSSVFFSLGIVALISFPFVVSGILFIYSALMDKKDKQI